MEIGDDIRSAICPIHTHWQAADHQIVFTNSPERVHSDAFTVGLGCSLFLFHLALATATNGRQYRRRQCLLLMLLAKVQQLFALLI